MSARDLDVPLVAVPVTRAHNRRMPLDAATWERVFARLAEELPDCGTKSMSPRDLGAAALRGDDLAARQIVKDAKREGFSWEQAPEPDPSRSPRERAVYAALVDSWCGRSGVRSPPWLGAVAPAPEPVYLMGKTSKFVRRACEERAPEVLRKRNVYALPEYLDVL